MLFIAGMIISVWIIIGSSLSLNLGGYLSLLIYCVIGVVVYFFMQAYRKKHPELDVNISLTPADKERFKTL